MKPRKEEEEEEEEEKEEEQREKGASIRLSRTQSKHRDRNDSQIMLSPNRPKSQSTMGFT